MHFFFILKSYKKCIVTSQHIFFINNYIIISKLLPKNYTKVIWMHIGRNFNIDRIRKSLHGVNSVHQALISQLGIKIKSAYREGHI